MKDIQRVTVIGAGAMGKQIALNAATQGFPTTAMCMIPGEMESVNAWVKDYLQGRVQKGRMREEEADAARKRFLLSESYEESLNKTDLVIEAVPEVEDIKRQVLTRVGQCAPGDAIITTNSSYMVSSAFKDCIKDPSRLANLHYFNPALVMKLVEVAQGEHTSEETVNSLLAFCKKLGKVPVRIYKEIDGLLASRILQALTNEALFLVEQGYSRFEDIDHACLYGLGHPKGPFQLADMAGLDLRYFAARRILEQTGQKPIGYDLYKEKYEKGELGVKSGKGFYPYPK